MNVMDRLRASFAGPMPALTMTARSLSLVMFNTSTPPRCAAATICPEPRRPTPEIVTLVPTCPTAGSTAVIIPGFANSKACLIVVTPPVLATITTSPVPTCQPPLAATDAAAVVVRSVVVASGLLAWRARTTTSTSVSCIKSARRPANRTWSTFGECARRCSPEIVTSVPCCPLLGTICTILGGAP